MGIDTSINQKLRKFEPMFDYFYNLLHGRKTCSYIFQNIMRYISYQTLTHCINFQIPLSHYNVQARICEENGLDHTFLLMSDTKIMKVLNENEKIEFRLIVFGHNTIRK